MKGLTIKGKVSSTSAKHFEVKGEKGLALEIKISDIKINEMLCVLFNEMAETTMEHIQEGDTIQVTGDITRADNGEHILRAKVLALLATAEEEEEENDE